MNGEAKPRIMALFGSAVVFGQERGNIEALAALEARGCEVLCLIRNEPWSVTVPQALDARGLAWCKVPYIEHWQPGRLPWVVFRNPIAFMIANWKFVRIARAFRPTHIHAFNALFTSNFLVGLKILGVPMVYRAGDEPTVHRWIWRVMWRFVVGRTDRFVANSRFVARALTGNGVPGDRISLIYNAPPARGTAPMPSTALPARPGLRFITFVGQIAEHKGPHILVEAFAQLANDFPEAYLLIAGRISEWRGDWWGQALRDRAGADPLLAGRVTFLGQVDYVPALLGLTEVHVAPSIFDDPSPNVVMEAKRAACPSVVFARGGLPELVEDGVDGLVCTEPTAEALAATLRAYLEDPALARRHGQAARASLARLGVDGFEQAWVTVYRSTSRAPADGTRAHLRRTPPRLLP